MPLCEGNAPVKTFAKKKGDIMWISEIFCGAPSEERGDLETSVYRELDRLSIPFERVDNDAVHTMEECVAIDQALGAEIRKTIVLCNRKKTSFYLVVLPASKSVDTKEIGRLIGVSGLSFAPADKLQEILGAQPGSATVMGIIHDQEAYVQVIIDREVADEEYFACNPGVNTSHIKLKTSDLIQKYLASNLHKPMIIAL